MIGSIALATTKEVATAEYVTLPIILSILGLVGSFIGLFANKLIKAEPAAMLRNATNIAIGVFAVFAFSYMRWMDLGGFFIQGDLFWSVIIGCISGIVIGLVTEYYTGGSPIKKLAESSETGAATNIIYGLSLGMESRLAGYCA